MQAALDAFARHSWHEAYTLLTDAGDGLDADQLEMLAVAANLIGRDQDSVRAWERAHVDHLRAGRRDRAAQSACWAALTLLLRGEMAQARRVDDPGGAHRRGAGSRRAGRGAGHVADPRRHRCRQQRRRRDRVRELADQIITIAIAVDEPDLLAFGRLTAAQAALVAGDIARSMRLFDEVMVSVTMGDVSPIPAGIIYCAVVDGCVEACDLRRAAEWTEALRRWCDDQPDLVPYRGQCMVHRSQVLLAQGSWADAAAEAELACQRLADPFHPALGLAHYQRGELHRLRGELDAAADAYREASRYGHDPVPGFALLRLAEGDVDGAVRAARRMLDEHGTGPARSGLLAAAVEVRLAAGDTAGARELADELASLAAAMGTEMLAASALLTRAGPSCWLRETRLRPSPRCGPPARRGATCRCRTRSPGRASSSGSPTGPPATTTPPTSSSTAPGPRSSRWAPPSTWPGSSPLRRPSPVSSPSGSARCCGSSPRARPTARSPPSS